MILTYKGHRIFAFSDTHGMHERVIIPKGIEILICVGDVESDFCNIETFMAWYASIPAKLRLFTPGNHDLSFDLNPCLADKETISDVIILRSRIFDFEDLTFCSIDARPWLFGPTKIPNNVDFLLTHGAAKGYLDNGKGCIHLSDTILRHKPKVHLFGHIHECGNRSLKEERTEYHNVCLYKEFM